MLTLPFLLAGGCVLSLFLTPLARLLAESTGLVDRPDGRRKIHPRTTPTAGGPALLLSGGLALGLALLAPGPWGEALRGESTELLGLGLAALAICAVGVADDFGYLRGRHKLLGQFLAVLILTQFGLVVRTVRLFDWQADLGLLAVPFTVLWLLAVINSLNLLDGSDGLLGSVALILSLALAGLAVLGGRWADAGTASALAGALLGFLAYNRPPAQVFLGDSGSLVIGLVVGTLTLRGTPGGPATFGLAAPLALLAVPFFDTVAAIVRRRLTGRSIYTPDRGHLHHCLLRRGLSTWGVLVTVSAFVVLAAAGALASVALGQDLVALASAGGVVGILITGGLFGHAELALLWKRLTAFVASFGRGTSRDRQRHTEVRLQGSLDWADLWADIAGRAHWLNLQQVRLDVNAPALHEGYHARWEAPTEVEETQVWRAVFPLMAHGLSLGRLEVVGRRDREPIHKQVASVLELVVNFESAAAALVAPRPLNAGPLACALAPAPVNGRQTAGEPEFLAQP